MKTKLGDSSPGESLAPVCASGGDEEIDLSLLKDSLSKTTWERMQANDDALRFADTLRAAMEKRNAKPERIDPPAG
jgi:hypothetical protein